MQQCGFTLQNYTPEEKLQCPKDYLLYGMLYLCDSLHYYNQFINERNYVYTTNANLFFIYTKQFEERNE